MITRLWERLANHDANEERRYLHEGRVNLAWCWYWTGWTFGIGFDLPTPYDSEWGVWIAFGPISFDAYVAKRDRCGAWPGLSVGGCTLPAGHNQGKVDIPDMHRLPDRS